MLQTSIDPVAAAAGRIYEEILSADWPTGTAAADERLTGYCLTSADGTQTAVLRYLRESENGAYSIFKLYETTADSEDSTETDTDSIEAYLRVGESQIIYKLDGADFTALMEASYDDLRHQEVFWGDFADVTQLDIELEGESHTITSTGSGEDRVYTYNDAEIDLTDIQTAIEALTADSFTTEAAAGQEEIALTLHLDNEDFPTVTIRLTRYDGSLCLAEVDGESVCLVSRSAAMDLVEAVQAIVLGG